MTRARAGGLPIRVSPAPAHDPPYDDETPVQWWPPDVLQPLLELPGMPADRPGRRSDRGGARPAGPDRPAAAASPPTIAAATRFVNTCLEILNGYRPVGHARLLADPLAATAVVAELTHAVQRFGPVARKQGLVRLRAMRTCEPRPGIAEIAIVVGCRAPAGQADGRAWGLAFRLQRQHGRWQCTAAQLL